MLQLQEAENWKKPAATTWAAEFLLREGENRECLGSWINSSAVHEAKKRRAKQVITCSFPCGKWLHRIGARKSPGCELCKRERQKDMVSDYVWRQWRVFKAQDVNRKRKVSLAPIIGVGGI